MGTGYWVASLPLLVRFGVASYRAGADCEFTMILTFSKKSSFVTMGV
jgi:hypothetical protein